MSHKSQCLYFLGNNGVEIREEPIVQPGKNQVLVKSLLSGISAGSELLFYRGQVDPHMEADVAIGALKGEIKYPQKYGYAVVGQIIETGSEVDRNWNQKNVFCFHPHQDIFTVDLQNIIPLAEDCPPEDAVFLPNMESAVNFIMDGKPVVGENVMIFGQGILGLLTTAVLSRFPLNHLITADYLPLRRDKSLQVGAHMSLDAHHKNLSSQIAGILENNNIAAVGKGDSVCGIDLIFELSGNPAALDSAIRMAAFGSRIIIGSWYGKKRANLDLGHKFHRDRITLISSQISTIQAEFTGRWTKKRRLEYALKLIRDLQPSSLITHRIEFSRATEAYRLLQHKPEDCLQVILTYGE
jgi:2-desacetyl-2-hydroxyethyl bacteriochlorophyllide A dehydrogenase